MIVLYVPTAPYAAAKPRAATCRVIQTPKRPAIRKPKPPIVTACGKKSNLCALRTPNAVRQGARRIIGRRSVMLPTTGLAANAGRVAASAAGVMQEGLVKPAANRLVREARVEVAAAVAVAALAAVAVEGVVEVGLV